MHLRDVYASCARLHRGTSSAVSRRQERERLVHIRKTDGFALVDVLFVCALMGVLSAIALPRLVMAKQSAGAASAIGSLRAIHSAELTFALTCGAGFYAPNLTALGKAPTGSREAFISAGLATANAVTRSGYLIAVDATAFDGAPPSCNGLAPGEAGQGWRAYADPVGGDNGRYFGVNVAGAVWEHTATLRGMPEVGLPTTGHPIN
jgi:type II secretory pathway pseudopilin PulG